MRLPKKSNVLILSHFYKRTIAGGGPPQEIRDFFLSRVKKIYYIEHPFPSADDHRSSLTIYEDGIMKNQILTPALFGPGPFFYVADIFITWYFLLRAGVRFDLCAALDNLNTFTLIPFRKLGRVKKLVFYTIDYSPLRFKNKILNALYQYIDGVACYHADKIWVLSRRMIVARKRNGVNSKKSAKSIVLPMGANLQRIKILPTEKIHLHDIVFVGFLLEKQGIQLVLEALPKVISKIPDVRFIIIGQGEYEQKLKEMTKQLKITRHVIFKGFVKDHKDVEDLLCQSGVGIAPYVPAQENYTFYTDPGKPKLYLGCGLPVVITGVPAIAKVIEKRKAGIMIDYTTKGVVNAITTLFSGNNYQRYRENAIRLSKDYDTDSLIQKAIDKT